MSYSEVSVILPREDDGGGRASKKERFDSVENQRKLRSSKVKPFSTSASIMPEKRKKPLREM